MVYYLVHFAFILVAKEQRKNINNKEIISHRIVITAASDLCTLCELTLTSYYNLDVWKIGAIRLRTDIPRRDIEYRTNWSVAFHYCWGLKFLLPHYIWFPLSNCYVQYISNDVRGQWEHLRHSKLLPHQSVWKISSIAICHCMTHAKHQKTSRAGLSDCV